MRVLLSIKPEYAAKIFEGTKRYEFRKKIFNRTNIKSVVVYVTKPTGLILGEFDIEKILDGTPAAIWSLTSSEAGISKDYFDSYFHLHNRAYALKIGHVRLFSAPVAPRSISGSFTPPQSFMYIEGDEGFEFLKDSQLKLFAA